MRTVIVAAALLLLTTTAAVAQQPTAIPDSASMAQMAGMFNQMGPMYESMMQSMVEGTIKAFEKPETIERLARFSRRYYDALIKQGFTKVEALQIVAGAGIAGVKAGR
jgi:Spy/CpxP family protein refolding chaperone